MMTLAKSLTFVGSAMLAITSFTISFAQADNHTGTNSSANALGEFVGGSASFHYGVATGWDDVSGNKDTAGMGGFNLSASVPLASRPVTFGGSNWFWRAQGNLFLHAAENPSSNGGTDPKGGISAQIYLQNSIGSAIAADFGFISANDLYDAHWYGIQHIYIVGHHLLGHYFDFGEFDYDYPQTQSPSFWTVGGDLTGFYHDDMVSVGLMSGYGEIHEEGYEFSQLGLTVNWKPRRERNLTLFADGGFIWHAWDNPSVPDIDLTYVGFGVRFDFNNSDGGTGSGMTLREQRVFTNPFYTAPSLIKYHR